MKPEQALDAISKALFPAPREQDGFLVCGDGYWNLTGALMDLERMGGDPVCIQTIQRVQQQILEVSKILQEAGYK